MFRFLFAVALGTVSAVAPAQPADNPSQTVHYRSAFDGYRPWVEQPLRNWREVNDEVERLGGHAGHLRDAAAAPKPPPALPAGTVPQPAASPGRGGDGSQPPGRRP